MKSRATAAATLVLAFSLTGCAQGPGDVAVKMEKAAAAGKTSDALDYLDPTIRQMGGMKLVAAMNDAESKMNAKGGLKDVEVTNTTTNGDQATVTVKETYGNGSTGTSTEKMRKVDGKWYVTM